MPSKYRVRSFFAPFVKFLARLAKKAGFSPNGVTFSMVFASILATGGYLLFSSLIWFAVWIFITGLLDGVDGALARLLGRQTRYGGFFDSVLDRVSEGILYLGLLMGSFPRFPSEMLPGYRIGWNIVCFLGLFCSVMISYSRARTDLVAKQAHLHFDTNIGVFGRSERLLAVIFWAILSVWFPPLVSFWVFAGIVLGFAGMMFYRVYSYRSLLLNMTPAAIGTV